MRDQLTDDPRPDLKSDSLAWHWLLTTAYDATDAGPLFQTLHGARCLGARLSPSDSGGWMIQGGAEDNEGYLRHVRPVLVKSRVQMETWLRHMSRVKSLQAA